MANIITPKTRNLSGESSRISTQGPASGQPTPPQKPYKCLQDNCVMSFGKPKQLKDHMLSNHTPRYQVTDGGAMDSGNDNRDYNLQDGGRL